MAFSRMGSSDVYMIHTTYGHLECFACRLKPNESGWYDTYCSGDSFPDFYNHVLDHLRAGHKVSMAGRRRIRLAAHRAGWKPRKKVIKK